LLRRRRPETAAPAPAEPETSDEAAQRIADEIFALRRTDPNAYFEAWQERGLHIMPVHFYTPIPNTTELKVAECSEMVGIDLREEEQLRLLREVFPPLQAEVAGTLFDTVNFGGTDALALYCMIRHIRPATILEVGGGASTLISLRALERNGGGRIRSIDPYPGAELREATAKGAAIVPARVQDVPLAEFEALRSGDVLFIDSTHTVRRGGDVTFLILEVLPRLQPGVYVQVHDIFLPFDYPLEWARDLKLFWGEQYMLQAFLSLNPDFRVVLANNWLATVHLSAMRAAFPVSTWWGGGSFWIRREELK
jgi:hypothetical protein